MADEAVVPSWDDIYEKTVSGPYVFTWNEQDIGICDDSGARIRIARSWEKMTSGLFGPNTTLNMTYQGKSVMIDITSLNYDRQSLVAACPESAGYPGGLGYPGQQASQLAKVLKMVPANNNLLARTTFTCHKAIAIEDLELLLSTRLREVPFRFVLLPDLTKPAGQEFWTETEQ